jgi:hypothetical protein
MKTAILMIGRKHLQMSCKSAVPPVDRENMLRLQRTSAPARGTAA